MVDLRLFKTFLAVLETGTYSAAAQKLDYAQSTVTKHIQLLEADYGGQRLLRRQGNRMIPTEQGRVLQSYAVPLLRLYEESRQAFPAVRPQTIRLGATCALSESVLPAVIQRIHSLEPGALLHLTNGNPDMLYGLLKGGRLDMIFVIDRPCSYGGFAVRTIRRERLAVMVPLRHPLASRPGASFEDIQEERLILTEEGCRFRQVLLELFAARRRTPKIVMELDSVQAVRRAVSQGQGIGFLPEILTGGDGGLAAVPFAGEGQELYSQAVCLRDSPCAGMLAGQAAEAAQSALSAL